VTLDPLRLSYRIDCPPDHAFDVWTTRLSAWWPRSHTTSGDPDATVTLEPRLGGRIFERTTDGREIDWGEITVWEPAERVEYVWHIGRTRADATDVSVAFVDTGDGGTRLEIVHSGWERLGAEGAEWRRANTAGWDSMLPAFRAAAEA
jgi:activator of Hsp90 ATPase-like protein